MKSFQCWRHSFQLYNGSDSDCTAWFIKRLKTKSTSKKWLQNFICASAVTMGTKFTTISLNPLQHNNKEEKEILPFVTQYQPSVSTLKEVLMKNWNLIQNQPLLRQIFKEPPIISYKKGKSLKDMLVRAKIWKVYTRFHAGMDVRPVTPCIFLTN